MDVIEKLIALLSPKSIKLITGTQTIPKSQRLQAIEVFSALNSAGSKYHPGMMIVKAKHLEDMDAQTELLNFLLHRCVELRIPDAEIVSSIIVYMLLERPLPTQKHHVKALYKRYGSLSKTLKSENKKLQDKLNQTSEYSNRNKYLREQLQSQINTNLKKIDNYAEARSLHTIKCPACQNGCNECGGKGKIQARMIDARGIFDDLGIPYFKHKFLTTYWTKIVFLVGEMQVIENEAITAMRQRMESEKGA